MGQRLGLRPLLSESRLFMGGVGEPLLSESRLLRVWCQEPFCRYPVCSGYGVRSPFVDIPFVQRSVTSPLTLYRLLRSSGVSDPCCLSRMLRVTGLETGIAIPLVQARKSDGCNHLFVRKRAGNSMTTIGRCFVHRNLPISFVELGLKR